MSTCPVCSAEGGREYRGKEREGGPGQAGLTGTGTRKERSKEFPQILQCKYLVYHLASLLHTRQVARHLSKMTVFCVAFSSAWGSSSNRKVSRKGTLVGVALPTSYIVWPTHSTQSSLHWPRGKQHRRRCQRASVWRSPEETQAQDQTSPQIKRLWG